MNKVLIGILAVFLLAFVGTAYAAPVINGTIPAQIKSEDNAPWTLDLSAYESGNNSENEDQLDWSASGVDTAKFTTNFDAASNIITFTPVANAYGSDTITLTLTSEKDSLTATQDIVVTLTPVNDAPVWNLKADYTVKEDEEKIMKFKTDGLVSDIDSLTLTYTVNTTEEDLVLNEDYTFDGIETFTLKGTVNPGVYTFTFVVSDGALTDTANVDFVVVPEDCLCEEGELGNLELDINEPDNGETYKPGETIELEVTVDNNEDEDLDVEVYAALYDPKEDEIIAEATSEAVDINDGDSEDITLNLEIPVDQEIEDGNYVLYIKAYEEGQEDDYCVQSSIEIEIEREKNDVIISKFEASPTNVAPGETVDFIVIVYDIGTTDEDDVTVKLIGTELGLKLVSNQFNLEEGTDDDSYYTARFSFVVPSKTAAGEYDITAGVYDEDDDLYDTSDATEEFIKIVVGGVGGNVVVPTDEVAIKIENVPTAVEAGKSYSLPIKVTNGKTVQDTFTVKLTNIDDWATSTSVKSLTLKAGQTETVYMYLKANEGLSEGKYSATVEIKDNAGKVAGTKTITLGGETQTTASDWKEYFGGSKLFWIIGDIILVIVAVFFIKLIFSRGRKPVKESRL